MMVDLTTLLTTVNTVILVGICLFYFKKNYVVMDINTYDQIADALEELNAIQEESKELAGGEGYGFFREALDDQDEETDD